ncbi:hypothetical protein [Macellibacteroides fermentans]|uniref:Outer membrane protein n=1 Tax=Parabacteroides chartae TaxID=1037355 RepID=A0A1T5DNG8_9BACT|nr:hypothetical protein [Parabacteroides chartae]SKB73258.1 hypothetical protein SAMN05660349_02538 [Parabacteroides chartae]
MKRFFLLITAAFVFVSVSAQMKDFSYKFYGRVRTDVFYNSRHNVESVEGAFFMYPKDIQLDPNGEDLNAVSNSGDFIFCTRLGLDITGPMLFNAKTTAKIETDFGGFSTSVLGNFTTLRIRHAYVNLDWGRSSLLVGQTWHPLFGEVLPSIVNLNTGCPFQPFSRSPQLQYNYKFSRFNLKAAAVFQNQYRSSGPLGSKMLEYSRDAVVPEMFVGIDYRKEGFIVGVGADVLTLTPRTQSTKGELTYKVSERNVSASLLAFASYSSEWWKLNAKTIYGQNNVHTLSLGGYGVTSIDPVTGAYDYVNFNHSTSWVNVVYGKKWQVGLFGGFTKNLGTNKPLVSSSMTYGMGMDIDKLYNMSVQTDYNIKNFTIGVEYSYSVADYGTIQTATGKVTNTHAADNHRIAALCNYSF